jgi:hypothetical protein
MAEPMKKRDLITPAALVGGAVLTTTAFLMAFLWAPPAVYEDGFRYDLSFQIFYFHVPVAEASFLVFAFAAFYAIRFLMTKDRVFDTKSRIAMERRCCSSSSPWSRATCGRRLAGTCGGSGNPGSPRTSS